MDERRGRVKLKPQRFQYNSHGNLELQQSERTGRCSNAVPESLGGGEDDEIIGKNMSSAKRKRSCISNAKNPGTERNAKRQKADRENKSLAEPMFKPGSASVRAVCGRYKGKKSSRIWSARKKSTRSPAEKSWNSSDSESSVMSNEYLRRLPYGAKKSNEMRNTKHSSMEDPTRASPFSTPIRELGLRVRGAIQYCKRARKRVDCATEILRDVGVWMETMTRDHDEERDDHEREMARLKAEYKRLEYENQRLVKVNQRIRAQYDKTKQQEMQSKYADAKKADALFDEEVKQMNEHVEMDNKDLRQQSQNMEEILTNVATEQWESSDGTDEHSDSIVSDSDKGDRTGSGGHVSESRPVIGEISHEVSTALLKLEHFVCSWLILHST